MALRATQQSQRDGTTSCASRPSAGIDRAKCLISLKATGEQKTILSPVTAANSSAWPTGTASGIRNVVPVPGPPACNFSLRFSFGDAEDVGPLRALWGEPGVGWAGASLCHESARACHEKSGDDRRWVSGR